MAKRRGDSVALRRVAGILADAAEGAKARGHAAIALMVATATILSGCANMPDLPSYDTVEAEVGN